MKSPSTQEKTRFTSLDGLRGLAALSVFFSHTSFNPGAVTQSPLFTALFQMISAGANSVQILFVLSGFLMSSLYPIVLDPQKFWQKRYTRIFPLFTVVVIFLWLSETLGWGKTWQEKMLLLFSLAVLFSSVWKFFESLNRRKENIRIKGIGQKVFWSFLFLQGIFLVINFVVTPHFVRFHQMVLPEMFKDLLILFSNLTLTTPFANGIPLLSSVFWSLAPEILFYLLFPLIVVPLIQVGKKHGFGISLLLFLGLTKILFDLQYEFWLLAELKSISISRSSGFMVGVVIGSLFIIPQEKAPKWWLKIKYVASQPIVSLLILLAFAVLQWLSESTGVSREQTTLAWFYLASSWIIGALIITALQPKSLANRFFSNRILVFLGTISYSFYLIHRQLIFWGWDIMTLFGERTTMNGWYECAAVAVELVLSIFVSSFLFYVVERLYFLSKKQSENVLSGSADSRSPSSSSLSPQKKAKEQRKNANEQSIFTTPRKWQRKIWAGATGIILLLFFFISYAGNYSPSLLISRVPLHSVREKKFFYRSLTSQPLQFSFVAKYPNLGALILPLGYNGDAQKARRQASQSAMISFQVFNSKNQQIFKSERHAYEIEGESEFPFGFPTIADSAGQQYTVVLTQEKGSETDQVVINETEGNSIAEYTRQGKTLTFMAKVIVNRIIFVVTKAGFWFAIGFSMVVIALWYAQNKEMS
jgi:peptidoglycan/LPS O-acetylase OafA/YrhL